MEAPGSPPRIISMKDLSAETESRRAKLDFSQTQRGPGCSGCFNFVFETVCGHAYVVRERHSVEGSLVCEGSEVLTVHWDDVTLAMGRVKCKSCRKVQKYPEHHSEARKKWYARHLSPKMIVSKLRTEAVKEQWQRKLIGRNHPVAGVNHAQLDLFSAEKENNKNPKVPSTSSRKESKSSDFVGDKPITLEASDSENEWMERVKYLLQKVGSVSRAESDADSLQSPVVHDPSPAFIFRSPFLSKASTDQADVKTIEEQASS
ncbi:hypothetical protein DHEL01_v206957 [Diaporthe helianthi]|uniref:Uncharacterized protein n=1 Tax=Diaporthe helianthi TaxID=158607 RepID=A0A2P5HWM5_DIAHE|nr:hypothetical protein DHEL01_v206957 [Diaporthe helianthi]